MRSRIRAGLLRRRRGGTRLLLLVAMLLGPWPAAAAALCDHYGEELSPTEIESFHDELRMLAPVRHAQASRALRIVNVSRAEGFAPYASPPDDNAAVPAISVPRGFRRLQCRLVQMEYYFSSGILTFDGLSDEIVRRCVTKRGDVIACVDEFLTRAAAIVETKAPFDPEATFLMRRRVDTAFLGILLHEFAHVALRHFESDGAAEAFAESEADAYALLRIVGSKPTLIGPFSTFSILASADPYLESGGGAHGRSACRALVVREVVNALEEPAGRIGRWSSALFDERAAPPAQTRPPPSLPIAGDTGGCVGASSRIGAIAGDLGSLAALTDRVGRPADASSAATAVTALLALPMSSDEGRSLRLGLVATLMRRMMFIDGANEAQQLDLFNRILARPDLQLMASADYGRLVGSAAIAAYLTAPPGSSLDAQNAMVHPMLLRSEYYNPRFAPVQLYLGTIDYISGRCAEGRRRLGRLVELSNDPRGTEALVRPIFAEEDSRGCARAGLSLRETALRLYAWR